MESAKDKMNKNSKLKTLIIVESPTKAKVISSILPDCTIIASEGHIRDLPNDELGVNLQTFEPEYFIVDNKNSIIEKMKKALNDSEYLVLATDSDREGESIAWHLKEVLKPTIPTKRIVFHEITKKAILNAMDNPRDVNMNMVNAQTARRVLDRLFGYMISPILWSKLSLRNLSAGRVQSPTLKLVVDRELERMKYKVTSYNVVQAILSNSSKSSFSSSVESYNGKRVVTGKDFFDETTGELKNADDVIVLTPENAKQLALDLQTAEYKVVDIKQKEVRRSSPPPYITSTLQQDANTKLHYTPHITMSVAQSLYEKGWITYMRTDSPYISEEGIQYARKAVEQLYGKDYLLPTARNFVSKDKNAQEAHEAIRPSIKNDMFVHPDDTGLTGREKTLYSLIYARCIATQMKDAVKMSGTVVIEATSEKIEKAVLVSRGMEMRFKGYLKAFEKYKTEDEENVLPSLKTGELLKCISTSAKEAQTSPKNRYTEASLIKKMEEIGIGRPSTYASTLTALITKRYVVRIPRSLQIAPTFLGVEITQFLDKYFEEYSQYSFTSDMESELDKISEHNENTYNYLSSFYAGKGGLKETVEAVNKSVKAQEAKILKFPTIKTDNYEICYGRFGAYIQLGNKKNKSIPKDWLVGDLSNEKIDALLNDTRTLEEKLDDKYVKLYVSPTYGYPVYYSANGKYGPFWFVGSTANKKDAKFCAVPRGTVYTDWSNEDVEYLFSLPRVIGKHPENNEDIQIGIGRYGAFVRNAGVYASLSHPKDIINITIDDAIALIEAKKKKK